jgi:hypothetical protein
VITTLLTVPSSFTAPPKSVQLVVVKPGFACRTHPKTDDGHETVTALVALRLMVMADPACKIPQAASAHVAGLCDATDKRQSRMREFSGIRRILSCAQSQSYKPFALCQRARGV